MAEGEFVRNLLEAHSMTLVVMKFPVFAVAKQDFYSG